MNYYNGYATRSGVWLFALQHGRKVVEEFSPAYYFCITIKDSRRIKKRLKKWKRKKYLTRTKKDHGFLRLYCETSNLRRNDDGEFEEIDAHIYMLEALEDVGIQIYEADLSSLQRYMIDHDIDIESNYRVGYFDIETDDRLKEAAIDDEDEARERDEKVYEMIEIGRDRIISAAVVDSENEYYFTAKNEKELLEAYLDQLSNYTLLVSWYGRGFDWPYLKARCKHHGIPWTLGDVNHVDFHKWFTDAITCGSIKDRPYSLKLGDVCAQYIGEKKTEDVQAGHGRLWELYLNDKDKLREYNLQDCKLLMKLDQELHINDQVIAAAKICGVFPGRSSITMLIDSFLLRLARKTKRRLITRKWHRKPRCKPPGGRVYMREPGTKENVLCFDFASYYNTIMRYWNIGPDTMLTGYKKGSKQSALIYLSNQMIAMLAREHGIGELEKGHIYTYRSKTAYGVEDALDRVYTRVSKSYTMSEKAFLHYFFKFKQDHKSMTVTVPFPIFFDHTKKSICVEALEIFTAERNKWKKKRLEKQEVGKVDVSEFIMVNVWKLLGNGMYGQFGAIHSRFYHEAMPACVTLGGQFSTKITKDWFEGQNGSVWYIDTDSNQLTHDDEDKLIEKWKTEYHLFLHNELKKRFEIEGPCPIELELEKKWSRMLYVTKKRYAGRICMEDGKKVNKVEIKGLGPARRDSITFRKIFEEFVIDRVLRKRGDIPTVRFFEKLFRKKRKEFDLASLSFTHESMEQFAKRVTIRRSPNAYDGNQTHIRIIKSMARRGDFAGVGQMFAYIRIESKGSMKDGEELSYVLKRKLNVDWDGIWRDWIWRPIRQLLEAARPEGDWMQFSPQDKIRSEKWYRVIGNRIDRNEKVCDETKRVRKAIGTYQNFTHGQKVELVERLEQRA